MARYAEPGNYLDPIDIRGRLEEEIKGLHGAFAEVEFCGGITSDVAKVSLVVTAVRDIFEDLQNILENTFAGYDDAEIFIATKPHTNNI